MSPANGDYTFDALCRLDNKALDKVMDIGVPPVMEELIGWEFKGWNINPATNITRTRKFKKGFFGQQGEDHAWGYNVAVKQSDFAGPWVADPSDAAPRRYYFFGVVPVAKANKPKVKNSLVIDYRLWDEYFKLNPVGYTVDYLIHPDPSVPPSTPRSYRSWRTRAPVRFSPHLPATSWPASSMRSPTCYVASTL
jgi:hypothetical protein